MSSTCHNQIESGKDERENDTGGGMTIFPFIFQNRKLKTKYLENRLSKLRTVFTFELTAQRYSKLDPMLICFDKHFFTLGSI